MTEQSLTQAKTVLDELARQGMDDLIAQGETPPFTFRRLLHCRYNGSDTELVVNDAEMDNIHAQFQRLHKQRFGFITPEKHIIIAFAEVRVCSSPAEHQNIINTKSFNSDHINEHNCYLNGQWITTGFYKRKQLESKTIITGPAVILDDNNTIIIEPGWQATLTSDDNLLLERTRKIFHDNSVGTAVDPVKLEIFNNLFMSVAEQMGAVLSKTAVSVNIKERLDFSCAIFDKAGSLIANAPHVPVHLGSMSESVQSVINDNQDMSPGDAWILNTPYNGGTHLPDVTVVRPVFDTSNSIMFYVASRGHHADIGGKSPGSAPADSTILEEEGIVIDNFKLVNKGQLNEKEILSLLQSSPWPARNPSLNLADIKAQLAACETGVTELLAMTSHYGSNTVSAYMGHVKQNAEDSVRKALSNINSGSFKYSMDDGSIIAVKIQINKQSSNATIDFTGTSP
ncbi:MAG: 5-oxoprolinase, partial [Gammaproteobacteria bacterium]|nr:5-oxoprolinase [Gammaproteobacteria bacterium]